MSVRGSSLFVYGVTVIEHSRTCFSRRPNRASLHSRVRWSRRSWVRWLWWHHRVSVTSSEKQRSLNVINLLELCVCVCFCVWEDEGRRSFCRFLLAACMSQTCTVILYQITMVLGSYWTCNCKLGCSSISQDDAFTIIANCWLFGCVSAFFFSPHSNNQNILDSWVQGPLWHKVKRHINADVKIKDVSVLRWGYTMESTHYYYTSPVTLSSLWFIISAK